MVSGWTTERWVWFGTVFTLVLWLGASVVMNLVQSQVAVALNGRIEAQQKALEVSVQNNKSCSESFDKVVAQRDAWTAKAKEIAAAAQQCAAVRDSYKDRIDHIVLF